MNEDRLLRELETRAELNREQAFNVMIAVLQELHDSGTEPLALGPMTAGIRIEP